MEYYLQSMGAVLYRVLYYYHSIRRTPYGGLLVTVRYVRSNYLVILRYSTPTEYYPPRASSMSLFYYLPNRIHSYVSYTLHE